MLRMSLLSIKDKKPNLNFDKLIQFQKDCVNKYFYQGLGVCAAAYVGLFLYTYLTSSQTLENIKDNIPSSTTPITFTSASLSSENHGSHAPKEDADIKDIIIEGLYQNTAQGLLPTIRRSDNLTSFRAYQHPFDFKTVNIAQKPLVAFVMQDYGLSQDQSKTALDSLPTEVSLVLNPYASLPNEWIKMAQNKGHEIWLGLPIQNEKTEDFGVNTIFHHISLPEKIAALYKVMSITQGYVGLASFTDNQLKTVPEHYSQLINKIYERGLGFLELNPNASKLLEGSAINLGAPHIKTNMKVLTISGDNHSFEELESMAKQNGSVVAVIPPYPKTIKNLAVWIEKVGKTDYTIAPVSAVYDLPFYEQSNANQQKPKAHDTDKHH